MSSQPLVIIPVRGGSKGISRKNLRTVGGISLIGRAVRTARAACAALGGGRVIVDSDDQELLAEGRLWGAETPYVRPTALASDSASSADVLKHALNKLGITASDARPIVLMQATSPLTPPTHVVDAVQTWRQRPAQPLVSVTPTDHPPAWLYERDADGVLRALSPAHVASRRQDLPIAYRLSGAVYVSTAADLLTGRSWVRSGETRTVVLDPALAIDIDHESDLRAADALARTDIAPVRIGDRLIGDGQRCFIIAEAGVNHDGDVAEAHRLVDAAADIGADAVKFQTWQTELVCRPGAPKAAYQIVQDGAGDDQFAMLKRLELPYAAHAELIAHARERGIMFLSTPDEIASARFLHSLGLPALKIGSAELDNLPYLAELGRFALPILLSTGMGTLPEVACALDALNTYAHVPVVLFHAVSSYPAPLSSMNVRAIATLRAAFNVPVGLSDHCPGPEAALAAVGLGLPIWEKHLTRDRNRHGPDHQASLDLEEFARQIALVRNAEIALGDGVKQPQGSEIGTRQIVRRRLHVSRDLDAGHILRDNDIIALRSDQGFPVSAWKDVVDRCLRTPLTSLSAIEEAHLSADVRRG